MPLEQAQNDSEEYTGVSIKDFLKIVRWVVKLLFSIDARYAWIYLISSILNNIQLLGSSYILAKIIDTITELAQEKSATIQDIYPLMGILIGFNLVVFIIRFFRLFSRRTLDIRTRPKVRQALYTKLYSLGIQTLEGPEINNKINRAEREIYGVLNFFEQVVDVITFALSAVVSLLFLIGTVPLAALIIMVAAIPVFLHDKKYRRIAWKFGYENTENRRKANSNAYDLMSTPMLQEIFINKAFNFLDKKFTAFNDWYAKQLIKMRKKWYIEMYALQYISDIATYVGFIMIFSKLIAGTMTIGITLFNYRIINKFRGDLDRAASMLTNIFEFAVRMRDIHILFETQPAFADGKIKLPALDKGPAIKVANISFRYPNAKKLVLKNISLDIKPGEKVAIVGHNGAGKTTLVKLLCKMYLPEDGKIIINSEDLTDIQVESWYNNMGVLFQDYNIYPQLTLRENVTIGDPNRKHEEQEVIDSLEMADALGLIDEFENGLDQILSEKYKGGVRPSTGQWQKIAIARFFYRNAPFVIFDEPTAAIDPVSEYNIFNRIYGFFRDKTVIIISHRFSTVRNADRILVVDKGEIIENGTHQELMAKDGKYAEAFKLQAEGYAD